MGEGLFSNQGKDKQPHIAEVLQKAKEVLLRRNGEHEITGVTALKRGEIKKFLQYSNDKLEEMKKRGNSRNNPHYQYHEEVQRALSNLIEALDAK